MAMPLSLLKTQRSFLAIFGGRGNWRRRRDLTLGQHSRRRAMGWFSPDMQTMKDLFLHSLQDIYYAEHQIEKALPQMVEKASDSELKKGFRTHLKQTKGQIKRLDQAFKKLKVSPKGTKCPAIESIIDEAKEIDRENEHKMDPNPE